MPVPQEILVASEPPLTLGSCVLRRPDAAAIVQNAILYFEGQRYRLRAWSVMPNHVHVIVQPWADYPLSVILHSWKSFTSTKINRLLGHRGALWERESFDHLIRTPEHVEQFAEYVEQNPVAASLCAAPGDWPFSSCGAGFRPAVLEFVDPRQTPFVPPRSRGELPHLLKPWGIYFVTFRLFDAVEVTCAPGTGSAGILPAQ